MNQALIIDDDSQIRKLLRLFLTNHNFEIHEADSCASGINQFVGQKPGIVLLDLGLPDGNGRDVLQMIRERGDTPVIILSVADTEAEITELLDMGADDYVTKPFGIGELMARIRVALRHSLPQALATQDLRVGVLVVRLLQREAFRDGQEERLTPTEWSLLELLIKNAGKIMTRRQIVRSVWGPVMEDDYNNLRVYINQLRRKIEIDPTMPQVLITEPGVGYRLRLEGSHETTASV